jgi:bacterioferritin (cytochrome b1)
MNQDSTSSLNRLLAIHVRSFIQYLRYAKPYIPPGRVDVLEALDAAAHDQDVMADRISRMVYDLGALPRSGEFPMEFTDMHDLGLDFLLQAAIRYQQYDVAAIGNLVEGLQADPAARAMAEEALGMAKGHLDTLREVTQSKAAA